MNRASAVSYLRVSRRHSGDVSLQLKIQQESLRSYLRCGAWVQIGEFTENEGDELNLRPALAQAVALCRTKRATLVIAKLGKLVQSPSFLSQIEESCVDVVAVDDPKLSRSALGETVKSAVARANAISASARVRHAKWKADDAGLGSRWHIGHEGISGSRASGLKRGMQAQRRAQDLYPTVVEICEDGVTTLKGIADVLNSRNLKAARGGSWSAVQVRRLLHRIPN